MEKVLQGKVALVTGGSRGIGRSIAVRLGRMGAAVAVHYNSGEKEALSVVAELERESQMALALPANLSDISQLRALFAEVETRFGRLDILVNNAGMLLTTPIAEMAEQEYDELMALNVKSVFFACQEAAKRMADGGRIINISSTVTAMLLPAYGAYAASKGAVDQITRVLAKELGAREITVNSLSPGPTDTALFRRGKSEEQILAMAGMAAMGRIGTPGDIADAVSLLVREEAGWISGQNIYANGGMAG